MEGIYRFADVCVKIQFQHGYFTKFAAGYEAEQDDGIDEEITCTPEDIALERVHAEKVLLEEEGAPDQFPDAYLETQVIYRKLCDKLVMRDILLFHSSAIAVDGKAYLFAARSGVGKSTHARLWREVFGNRAVMINDDKPLLRILKGNTEEEKATVIVFGTPWNGKHMLGGNEQAPVQGICLLERGEKNIIRPVSSADALSGLLTQAYLPTSGEQRKRRTELVFSLAKSEPIWRMECNVDREAAQVAYHAMKGN